MLSFTVNAQDKFIEDKTEIVGSSNTTTNNAKLHVENIQLLFIYWLLIYLQMFIYHVNSQLV